MLAKVANVGVPLVFKEVVDALDRTEGAIRLWVDEVLEVQETGLGLNPIDTIYVGLSYDTVDPVAARFDDVVVANQYIGP